MRKGRLRAGPCSGPDPGTPPRHSLTASQALSLKRSGWAEGQADFPTTKSVCVRVCERETERIHLDLENINTHGLYQWGLMKITLFGDEVPGGSDSQEPAFSAGDAGSVPPSGRLPGEGDGCPLQCSCLEGSMDRGAWWATWGCKELDMTEWLTLVKCPTINEW